jgi:hypothetical protein
MAEAVEGTERIFCTGLLQVNLRCSIRGTVQHATLIPADTQSQNSPNFIATHQILQATLMRLAGWRAV